MLNSTNISDEKKKFIPYSLWFCTILFFGLTILSSIATIAFTLLNLLTNPVEQIFNIFGLYIWNTLTAFSSLITFLIWLLLFHNYLSINIAITDTLRKSLRFSSNNQAHIGFSLYILALACILNVLNIILLILKRYLLLKSSQVPTITLSAGEETQLQFY